MLELQTAIRRARDRSTQSVAAVGSSADPKALQAILNAQRKHRTFATLLLDSLHRSADSSVGPSTTPEPLFVAVPEKLLGRWAYVALGKEANIEASTGDAQSAELDFWRRWDRSGRETMFANFTKATRAGKVPFRGILVTHGLTPVEDSTLLLADLGRAFRASAAVGLKPRVMLADVSWMTFNRSVRRFNLSEEQIEQGFVACLHRRRRLYQALGMEFTVHSIVEYEKPDSVHTKKLELIVNHYKTLTSLVWGEAIWEQANPISKEQLKMMDSPIQDMLSPSSPLQALRGFPEALPAVHGALRPHLEILKAIAKRFRILGRNTLIYYFAQYYAQEKYRGSYIKISPNSERDFDEPFDELDSCFKSWGDGHRQSAVVKRQNRASQPRMTAIYLPHYGCGGWRVLPYTPLSLDTLEKSGGKVQGMRDAILLLSDSSLSAKDKVLGILQSTLVDNFLDLNRMIADLVSFLQWLGRGRDSKIILNSACHALGYNSLFDIVGRLHSNLVFSLQVEQSTQELGDLWMSWLGSIEHEQTHGYTPPHITVACMTPSDWTAPALSAAADLVILANGLGARLAA